MMGAADLRQSVGKAGQSPVAGELAEDIARLNKEWREKRDSLRNCTKSKDVVPTAVGPVTQSAPMLDSKEPLVRETASLPSDNGLAEAAASGRLEDCQRILTYTRANVWGIDGTTPLFAAALWDHSDVVQVLLEAHAEPMQPNRSGKKPVALHAAALQENGKICMLLLGAKADPHAKDGGGVAPSDYASCSEAVWPHFAAIGCRRVSKDDLINKGVIRKASSALELELEASGADIGSAVTVAGTSVVAGQSTAGILSEFSRPGSAYVLASKHPPRPGSGIPGNRASSRSGSRSGRRPSGSPIDILAEGDEAAEVAGAPSFCSATVSGRPVSGYARAGIPPLPPSSNTTSEKAAALGSMRSLGL